MICKQILLGICLAFAVTCNAYVNHISSINGMSIDGEACDENPCGVNAVCKKRSTGALSCTCPPGYSGDAMTQCNPDKTSPVNTAKSFDNTGSHSGSDNQNCYSHSECPANRPACMYGVCKNPCDGVCGIDAECTLRGFTPLCGCPRDMTGNPFERCVPFKDDDICEPNPCGKNAACTSGRDQTGRERPVCNCLPGYYGDSLSSCQKGDCLTTQDCPLDKDCVEARCINTCTHDCENVCFPYL